MGYYTLVSSSRGPSTIQPSRGSTAAWKSISSTWGSSSWKATPRWKGAIHVLQMQEVETQGCRRTLQQVWSRMVRKKAWNLEWRYEVWHELAGTPKENGRGRRHNRIDDLRCPRLRICMKRILIVFFHQ